MLRTGILNPQINALLSRVRHTNTLVIADRGYPFWPTVETVDISLVDNIPTIIDVLRAIGPNFSIGRAWMAEEFLQVNAEEVQSLFRKALPGIRIEFEPHESLKLRTPRAIGLIRTADTIQFANIVLGIGMIIDVHQHFWHYEPAEFPWIDDSMAALRRDYLPSDLQSEIDRSGVDRVVAVQARQSLAETAWLLELAGQHPFIGGVIGWVPLAASDVSKQLDKFSEHAAFKAVRHVVQDEPSEHFLQDDRFNAGVGLLRRYNLAYDILIFERQLPQAIAFVDRHPQQRFVLDHLAKPRIRDSVREPWRKLIFDLARRENVMCKVSGLVTEADLHNWREDELRPYLDDVLAAFGPRRLLFGSDWPVVLLASSYDRWLDCVANWAEALSDDERDWLFARSAAAAYGIDVPPARGPA